MRTSTAFRPALVCPCDGTCERPFSKSCEKSGAPSVQRPLCGCHHHLIYSVPEFWVIFHGYSWIGVCYLDQSENTNGSHLRSLALQNFIDF